MDIFGIYDNEYTESGSVFQINKIGGSFIWSETGPGAIFTQSKFEEFEDDFAKILDYRDIKYFLGFHNHEIDKRQDNIIDYIKDKIYLHLKLLGIIDREAEVTDLRFK